jgi:hypothetical protein
VRARTPLVELAFCIVALLGMVGCTPGPQWDPNLGGTTSAQLVSKLGTTDTSSLKDVPVAEARERRDKALASLRSQEGGSEVADVLTKAFAQGNAGVPVYVGVGTFSGEKAIVVIEAYGPTDGNLDRKRLWVLSENGTPLYSSTSR